MGLYVPWQGIGLLRSLPHTAWCSWEEWVSPSSILRFPAEVWQLHNSLPQMQLTLRMLLVMHGLPGAVRSFPPVALADASSHGFSNSHSSTRQAMAMAKNNMYQAKILLFDRWSTKHRLTVTWVQLRCYKLCYDSRLLNRTEWWRLKTIIFFLCGLVWW